MSLLLSENKLGVHLAERTNGNVGVPDGKKRREKVLFRKEQ